MSFSLEYLPRMLSTMVEAFGENIMLKEVSTLEKEGALFVEDGNHGEYRPLADEFVEEGVPFVRPPNLVNGRIDLDQCQKINDKAFKRVRKGIGKGGDIVLTHNATVGRVAITKDSDPVFVTNPQTTVWRSENRDIIDPQYLYYFMKSSGFQEQLESHKGRNATFDYVSLTKQRSLVIPVLDIELQRFIGGRLACFDKKIELNRQTNQTLEQMAQAIFKSWFVDFEPTRAKAHARAHIAKGIMPPDNVFVGSLNLGEDAQAANAQQPLPKNFTQADADQLVEHAAMAAISGKPLSELDKLPAETLDQLKTTAALFPEKLVDSELGVIPEGWEVLGFKDIVKKYIDNRGKTPPITDKGIPLLEVKHLPEGSIKPNLNTTKYVDDETFETWFRAHLETDDLMISTVGTIGRICMVPEGVKIAIAQNLLGMRFNREKVSPYFMYYQMDGFRFRHDVDARLVITVQASIKRKDLETIDLLVPPAELQNIFEKTVAPFVAMQHSDQELKLAEVRDGLLPKLLSGELTVEESESK